MAGGPISPVGGGAGAGNPNDLWNILVQIPGAAALVRAFWAAVEAEDVEAAAAALEGLKRLVGTSRMLPQLLRILGSLGGSLARLMRVVGVAGSTMADVFTASAELEEAAALAAQAQADLAALAEAEALAAGAGSGGLLAFLMTPQGIALLVGVLVLLMLFWPRSAHGETSSEAEKEKTGKRKEPDNRLDEAAGRTQLERMSPGMRADPRVNPAAALNHQARSAVQQLSKARHKRCRCAIEAAHRAKSQAYEGFGPVQPGASMAFAPTGMRTDAVFGPGGRPGAGAPRPGRGHDAGSSGPGRGDGGGGRADPFSFPQPGGKRLPPPGGRGKPGETLPNAQPPGKCTWPDCLRGQKGQSAARA